MRWIIQYVVAIVLAGVLWAQNTSEGGWAMAVPGYHITLPKDNYPHYDFRTEWWYFTGNLRTTDGRPFGYQVTFFRYGYRPPGSRQPVSSRFVMDDVKFAHFAVTDVAADRFHFDSRVSRGAYGEAGFGDSTRLAWTNDWELDLNGRFHLKAAAREYSIDLELTPVKPVVLQGQDGLSQKADGLGHASYYYSMPRLSTSGTIKVGSNTYVVAGTSWYDREWSTNQLTPQQSGWNWFAIQLSDGTDLMLYQMRLKSGGVDPHSSGKWIAPDGSSIDLETNDFELKAIRTWVSPASKAVYPVCWMLTIPKLNLELEITPAIENQELNVAVVYWEGCIRLKGRRHGVPVDGVGYMELTGYAGESPGLTGSKQ